MSGQPITQVVIVGGGTAGWMAAAAISKIMGAFPGLSIRLIESEAIGTVGVGEATIPQINQFNKLLGVDEREFVRETHATYKLGIEFVDWTRLGDRYVHPFGFYGIDMLGIEFHHFWLKGRELGDTSRLDDYSIGAMAGKANKMFWPQPDQPNSPLARLGYAFQFDASRYAGYLRKLAEKQGVTRVEGRINGVEQDPESGHVTSVTLENDESIAGELFIDCSGFRSLLLGQTLEVPFNDWSKWLPCDRAVAIPCTSAGDREPLTRSTARPAGWQWRIPLQHRIGNGHVYSSAFMEDDAAIELLLANLDGEPLAEPNRLRFTGGHRAKNWEKNVVALGLAGGFLEPLESTAIHLVQAGIARLMAYWPTTDFTPTEIARFNAETERDYVDIRDFLVLHYKATERDDSEFWNYCRNLEPPDGLKDKLEMFRSSGRVIREHNELFTETSWLSVMACQGVQAGGYHPAAGLLPDAELLQRLGHVRQVISQAVSQMPTQEEFLASNGSAIDPGQRITA
ncbi:tryptophan halogenase family protein [Alteraurantiacibacter aquimixticola]|uniref:Tryptophan 7-halogenase n=1 Tax=Alteraurantiacibacter aquimixticola TaxID=2489173 RepID=A0A4T3F1D7_9SPHN|nr:tryptophan halogenase family protein [Alteraurantiacibacter aquimixticola]TIX50966.1 tryptophan 7-halogenase [Alteraurantiacibacter aquimixticola]